MLFKFKPVIVGNFDEHNFLFIKKKYFKETEWSTNYLSIILKAIKNIIILAIKIHKKKFQI